MKNFVSAFLIFFVSFFAFGQNQEISKIISLRKKNLKPIKDQIITSIEDQKNNLITISDGIWEAAETSLEEFKSSKLLIDYARANGFEVTENVADISTAFMATYGSGKPVIGILGSLMQMQGYLKSDNQQKKQELKGAGHGCGHNFWNS